MTEDVLVVDDLQSGDAFIYASIHRYLKEESDGPRFFVTRDRDFQKTEELLATIDCRLVLGFGEAIGALRPQRSN